MGRDRRTERHPALERRRPTRSGSTPGRARPRTSRPSLQLAALALHRVLRTADVALTTTPADLQLHDLTVGRRGPGRRVPVPDRRERRGLSRPTSTTSRSPAPATTTPPSRIGELLRNGTFSERRPPRRGGRPARRSLAVANGRLEATITSGGANPWDVIVGQSDIPVFAAGELHAHAEGLGQQRRERHTCSLAADRPAVRPVLRQLRSRSRQLRRRSPSPSTRPPRILPRASRSRWAARASSSFYLDNVSLNGPQPVSAMPIAQTRLERRLRRRPSPRGGRATSAPTSRAASCRRRSSTPARTPGTRSSDRTASRSWPADSTRSASRPGPARTCR